MLDSLRFSARDLSSKELRITIFAVAGSRAMAHASMTSKGSLSTEESSRIASSMMLGLSSPLSKIRSDTSHPVLPSGAGGNSRL